MAERTHFQLIVAIVPQGTCAPMVSAAKAAGAEGATILRGRGTGLHEGAKFLGVPVEPEKDVVWVMVPESSVDAVMGEMVRAGKLDQPGHGIVFALDVARVAGIVHRGEIFESS